MPEKKKMFAKKQTPQKEVKPLPEPKKQYASIGLPRGMKDTLPMDASYWKAVRNAAERLGESHGFSYIETPIVELTSLFVRGLGKQTDIVEKEMFNFTDQGGEDLVLRPEGTAPVARAYVSHGMLSLPQPVKLFYYGAFFRRERPQSGRSRQFHQAGFETLGEAKPVIDAELILVASRFFADLGVPVTVELNSIGDAVCREPYKEKLIAYYRANRNKLCETCKIRLVKNPLRLLDCKEDGCSALRAAAPQVVDNLCEDCKAHFMKVIEYLDEADLAYTLSPHLVRGLDYYTRTVFEIFPEMETEDRTAQSALAGGGRYDGLIEMLGGRPTPAAGFSVGIERTISAMKARNLTPGVAGGKKVFFAQLGEPAKRKAFKIFEELRRANLPVIANFAKDGLKAQMETANAAGVAYTVILGQKEVMDGTVIVRDMEAGIQEIVDAKKLVAELKKKLGLESL